MIIAGGVLVGFLGFLPMLISLSLLRRSQSTLTFNVAFYGLAAVAVSIVMLIAGLLACAFLARENLVTFTLAEGIVFLGATIVYVVYRNVLRPRKRG